jgi:hypothetical protein
MDKNERGSRFGTKTAGEEMRSARHKKKGQIGKSVPAELEAELAKVRKAAPPPPSENEPIYKYLKRVYVLCRNLAKKTELHDTLRDFAKNNYPKLSTDDIRLIVELTAPEHFTAKTKYKYISVLKLAFEEDVHSKDLIKDIKKHGGLNACVDLYIKYYGRSAAKKKSKKKSAK